MTDALKLSYEQRGVVPAPIEIIAAFQAWHPALKNDFGTVVKRSYAYQNEVERPLERAGLSDRLHAWARAATLPERGQTRTELGGNGIFMLSATLKHKGSDYALSILTTGKTDEDSHVIPADGPQRHGALLVNLSGPYLTPQTLVMFQRILKELDAPQARIAQTIKPSFEKLCR